MNIITATDGYKIGHIDQYQIGTNQVVSNWTPRKSRIPGIDKIVFFGQQYLIKKFYIKEFQEKFFSFSEDDAVKYYYRRINNYLPPGSKIRTDHIRELHKKKFLPIMIMSLPEGVSSPIRVPQSQTFATQPGFFWLVNYLETLSSCTIWKPCTSATISKEYKKIFDKYAMETVGNTDFTMFQGHDFSMRGMSGVEDACVSGGAHLLNFVGTDTIPAIDWLEEYYGADCEKEFIGGSVAATEHAVMCSSTGFYIHDRYNGDWSKIGEAEFEVFKRLITETYLSGIVSIVSDTFSLPKVVNEYLPKLKEEIMTRDGKLVIRPDSFWTDPVDCLCGFDGSNPKMDLLNEGEIKVVRKGLIESLWDIFGGTETAKGYKLLDSHISTIYGDAISIERAIKTCERLKNKGFASINWIAGIGSYTYQYQTRDTFGYAQKSTYCEVGDYKIDIFKDPITDNGTKKSARGLIAVYKDASGEYYAKDMATWEEVMNCELIPVFKDGKLLVDHKLSEIRKRIKC